MAKRFVVREVLFEVEDVDSQKTAQGVPLHRVIVRPVAVGNRLPEGAVTVLPFRDRDWIPMPGVSFGRVTGEEIREGVIG